MNKITVRIWTPRRLGMHGRLLWSAGVGHAAISLTVEGRKRYITWTAHGSPFAGFKLDPYHYIHELTREDDQRSMEAFFGSAEADYKFKIPATQRHSDAPGLDARSIEQYWLNRLENLPKYSFLSKKRNCTGCVAEALRAGGMDQFVPGPKNWLVQDAHSLKSWLLKAQLRMEVQSLN